MLCRGCREGKAKPLTTRGSPRVGSALFGFVSTENQATDDCFMLRFLSQFSRKPFFTFNSVATDTLSMPREPTRPSQSSRHEGTAFGGCDSRGGIWEGGWD